MRKQSKPGPRTRLKKEKEAASWLGDVDSDDSPPPATDASRANSNITDCGLEMTSVQDPHCSSNVRDSSPVSSHLQSSARVVPSTPNQTTAVASKQKVAKSKPRNSRKQLAPSKQDAITLKDIIKLQTSTEHLIPRLPFSRVIRELIYSTSSQVERITPEALEALQCAGEMYIIQRLQDAYLLTLHRGRVTLSANDLRIITFLRQND